MTINELKPKYQQIELIEAEYNYRNFRIIGLSDFEIVKRQFGNRKVLSVKDFNDTKSTSVIMEIEDE